MSKKTPKVEIPFPIELSARDIVKIICQFEFKEIEKIVVAIDNACQDWGVTTNLINHFLYMKEVGEKEAAKDNDSFDFRPKEIKSNYELSEFDIGMEKMFKKMNKEKE